MGKISVYTVSHRSEADHLPDVYRTQLRATCRAVAAVLEQLVTHSQLPPRQLEVALQFGRRYGEFMAHTAHTLPEAVLAFMDVRDGLVEAALRAATDVKRNDVHMFLSRMNVLLSDVTRVMLDAFVAMTEAPMPDEAGAYRVIADLGRTGLQSDQAPPSADAPDTSARTASRST